MARPRRSRKSSVHDYCPHCGAAAIPDDGSVLTPFEEELVAEMRKRPGEYISAKEIAEKVYSRRADGGALWAKESVRVTLWRLRERLGSGFIQSKISKNGGWMWVGGVINGKARKKEEARTPTAERATTPGAG